MLSIKVVREDLSEEVAPELRAEGGERTSLACIRRKDIPDRVGHAYKCCRDMIQQDKVTGRTEIV